jgi:predicted nucleotidyltransferase
MTDYQGLLRALVEGGVEFIIVGGAAATVHGSARLTLDLDIVYSRHRTNIAKLVGALGPLRPYLRGVPAGLPFSWDNRTVQAGLNFTLITSLGDLDLLGEITGGGRYEDLLPEAIMLIIFGLECRVLSIDALIRVKKAAGRPKDLEAIAELEVIRQEKRKTSKG